jgi:hypothetical protein
VLALRVDRIVAADPQVVGSPATATAARREHTPVSSLRLIKSMAGCAERSRFVTGETHEAARVLSSHLSCVPRSCCILDCW